MELLVSAPDTLLFTVCLFVCLFIYLSFLFICLFLVPVFLSSRARYAIFHPRYLYWTFT